MKLTQSGCGGRGGLLLESYLPSITLVSSDHSAYTLDDRLISLIMCPFYLLTELRPRASFPEHQFSCNPNKTPIIKRLFCTN